MTLKDMLTAQELVTKKDLALAKNELEAKIADCRISLETKLAENKHELLKWIIGLAVAQVTLMGAIAGIVIAILK